jgi:hypothetical protein
MASISVSLDRNADRHDVKLLKRELDRKGVLVRL